MKHWIQWAVSNRAAVNTLLIAVLLIGGLSAVALRREVFPEFELEIILISVPYPGASPAEVEEGVCQKIEESVRSIDGIKKQMSVAQEGVGFVILELHANVPDAQRVLNEVRSAVDRIPSFPEMTEDPEVKQLTLREPAIRLAVIGPEGSSGPSAELQLREVAEAVREDLLQLPPPKPANFVEAIVAFMSGAGSSSIVSQANVIGGKDYEIDIEIPESALRKHGLSLMDVARIVRRQNIELPGGTLRTENQEVLLRGKNKRLTGNRIAEIPLVTQPGGVVLTVGDLGSVRDEFADVTAQSIICGRPALIVSVDRTRSEDLLRITSAVKQYAASKQMPPGYELQTWADRSIEVRDRMDLLIENGAQGLVLVFLCLALFLELRLAFWVALGIPVSLLGTCAILLAAGHTLNMLTMFAFLMAMGIVVDDAIVIGENIYARRKLGESILDAAINGTAEVVPSVVSSVLTTILAFMPLFFVSGVMGKFIAVMPLTLIAILVVSLVEATFSLPVHVLHVAGPGSLATAQAMRRRMPSWLQHTIGSALVGVAFVWWHLTYPLRRIAALFHWTSEHASSGLEGFIENRYLPVLRWSLANPAVIVAGAVAILLVSLGLIRSGAVPFIVFPKIDSTWIQARVVFPDGSPEIETARATERLEAALGEVDAKLGGGKSLTKMVNRAVGEVTSPGEMRPEARLNGSHVGVINVELTDTAERDVTSEQILAAWRAAAGEFPGAEKLTFGTPSFGPGGTPIEFKLLTTPDNFAAMEQAVEEVKARLRGYPGVFDVSDDSRPGKTEYQLRIKPTAEALGITAADLAETVRAAYYGEEVMRLQRGRHEVKLMVRYPREDRRSVSDFRDIRVRTGDGAERPLLELAEVTVEQGYAEINRVDQLRSITISADVDDAVGNARNTVADLQAAFMPDLLKRYPGVRVRWEGQQEQTTESMRSLFVGFAIALAAMFLLLTLEFKAYFQPALIMAIIPFGLVGAIWGHWLLGLPLTMFSVFGLVALAGVVVNDSIVLVDFINDRYRNGMPLMTALVEAGHRRFRPVMLTSITTIAGLSPLLLERSFQAQLLIPMAASLVFGLALTTVLVLVLVPTFYMIYCRLIGDTEGHAASADSHDAAAPEAAALTR